MITVAVDSLVLFVSGLVLWTESNFPKERETECLPNCFQSKICELVSGELSKYSYIHSYTHRISSSFFWFITFKTAAPQNVTDKCHKIYLYAVPSGFSVLRHPNHLLFAGANDKNVTITQRFHATHVKTNRDFSWHTDCIIQL